MDALLPPFVAAFLAEWGDRTQLLAILLAARFRSPRLVLAGIAAAALANGMISAFGGRLLADIVPFRAITLMTGIALLLAGAGALLPRKPATFEGSGRAGAFLASFFAFAVLEFGDKTQFVTVALAGRTGSFWLTGLGAAAGVTLASAPAVFLQERLGTILPLTAIRIGAAVLLLIAASAAAISALRLA